MPKQHLIGNKSRNKTPPACTYFLKKVSENLIMFFGGLTTFFTRVFWGYPYLSSHNCLHFWTILFWLLIKKPPNLWHAMVICFYLIVIIWLMGVYGKEKKKKKKKKNFKRLAQILGSADRTGLLFWICPSFVHIYYWKLCGHRSPSDLIGRDGKKQPVRKLWNRTVCLCWGFTAQSTQWVHVEHSQFT